MTAHAAFTPEWGRHRLHAHRERCMHMSGHGPGRHGHRRHAPQESGFTGFLGRGQRAGRGDVRAGILALLAEEPMHGYQIMRELAERSGGLWRPSAGSIYPTLQLLQDEGLVRGFEPEGGRRLFELTDAGREALAALPSPAPWEAVADEDASSAIELRDLVRQVVVAARQVVHAGEQQQVARAKEVLRDARRQLYRILAEDPADAPSGEEPTGA